MGRCALRRAGSDNVSKLYYRKGTGDEWALINDEQVSGHVETPLGFSQDERIAYLRVQSADGPDAIVGWDIQANRREQVLRDAVADPLEIIYRNGTTIPVGAIFMADRPAPAFSTSMVVKRGCITAWRRPSPATRCA